MSRPTVSKAQTSYPIFAASFASQRPSLLVVAGGGGAGKHGVKNNITAFDFSSRAPTVQPLAEVEASVDDSITSLANLATKDGLILYAGINSSQEDRARGKNEHFRSFELQFPKSKAGAEKSDASISFLSKTSLLTPPQSASAKHDAYQRLVKLSPPQRPASSTPNHRIGAVASSLAGDDNNEIVIFSATSTKPQNEEIIERIKLPHGQEAVDLDIFDLGEGLFKVAYALDQEIFLQDVKYDFSEKKSKGGHRKVYTIPQLNSGGRSRIRCIRWLTPTHLLLLVNEPNRTGVEMKVLHLYEEGPAHVISRKKLPRHIKAATDLDVALLDKDSSGQYQIAIAIGAIDMSLSVYTMDYHGPSRDSLSSLHSFNSYDNVHGTAMTKVVFSPFYKPEVPGRPVGKQYLRLASTSLSGTISVETFQLQPTGSRFVLHTARSRNLFTAATYLVIAMVVAVVALLVQSLLDPEGNLTKNILPSSLQNAASQQKTFGESHREKRHNAILNNADSPIVKTSHRVADLLHLHLPHALSSSPDAPASADQQQKALVIHDTETDGTLSTEIHDDHEAVLKQHAQAKKWDDLSTEERKLWKRKLQDAGMWAVDEGETILKSIFFGQIGGLIGQVAQGVIG
ncbi:uncharacterized protein K460DRAFT_319677 [Cucurbitaria berberidis CBS 394.84]|uniref:Guanine nucleotide-exchange factor SEC12 n=1 Tax=Cucurbitaria berberidis CBS 394.84 TaxID=1168544 RepID=A0A9P4L563_9PLEO|nr:uncharacterized protein K460DRAFT_319677 [Cucurbitaria berberidis CBS 394.84]KAF1842017.1 hypothetical protein K460DRAFT_319677 [Cucurbitaria berberidis CBS 394.84]